MSICRASSFRHPSILVLYDLCEWGNKKEWHGWVPERPYSLSYKSCMIVCSSQTAVFVWFFQLSANTESKASTLSANTSSSEALRIFRTVFDTRMRQTLIPFVHRVQYHVHLEPPASKGRFFLWTIRITNSTFIGAFTEHGRRPTCNFSKQAS